MKNKALFSYWDYARRFLAWQVGEYQPRGAGGPGATPRLSRVARDSPTHLSPIRCRLLLPSATSSPHGTGCQAPGEAALQENEDQHGWNHREE